MSEEAYEQAMLEAFIGKPEKTAWYQLAFSKFNINGLNTMQWVWSWWAFFGGWGFLLYRKQYISAIVLFIVASIASIIPLGGLIVGIFAGGFSPYLIYKGYKDKKAIIENNISDTDKRIETMRELGGYNQWVIWVYSLFVTLFFLYVISVIISMTASGYN